MSNLKTNLSMPSLEGTFQLFQKADIGSLSHTNKDISFHFCGKMSVLQRSPWHSHVLLLDNFLRNFGRCRFSLRSLCSYAEFFFIFVFLLCRRNQSKMLCVQEKGMFLIGLFQNPAWTQKLGAVSQSRNLLLLRQAARRHPSLVFSRVCCMARGSRDVHPANTKSMRRVPDKDAL